MGKFRSLAILLAITCLAITNPAQASEATYGYITAFNPGLDGSGLLTFSTTGTRTARPGCSMDRWVISTNTNAGQFMASALLTAFSMKKRVKITGTGTCAVWPDTETVYYFFIED
jgi:uncharacterized protein YggE